MQMHAEFPDDQLAHFEHNLETWRQLWRVIELSDVIVLICDVRFAPLHFPPALFHHVLHEKKRHLILILNKCDLVPPALAAAWADYFTSTFPGLRVVKFRSYNANLATNPWNQRRFREQLHVAEGLDELCDVYESFGLPGVEQWRHRIGAARARLEEREQSKQHAEISEYDQPSGMLRHGRAAPAPPPPAPTSRQAAASAASRAAAESGPVDEKDRADEGGEHVDTLYDARDAVLADLPSRHKPFATIGLVGQPNVGKSTILNSIVGKHVVSTSRTPGHTKYFQTYFLSPELRLCDCPGLIFPAVAPKALQFLAGLLPVSQAQEPFSAIQYLAERVNVPRLLRLRLDEAWSSRAVCEAWALRRGYLTAKAGRPDVYRAAKDILLMAVDGRIALALRPPGWSASAAATAIDAATWAADSGMAVNDDAGDDGDDDEVIEQDEEGLDGEGQERKEVGESDGDGHEDAGASGPGSSGAEEGESDSSDEETAAERGKRHDDEGETGEVLSPQRPAAQPLPKGPKAAPATAPASVTSSTPRAIAASMPAAMPRARNAFAALAVGSDED